MFTSKKIMWIILLCMMHVPAIISLHFLHLSFHMGCINEINLVAKKLNVKITSRFIQDFQPKEFDGYAQGNTLYNIGHERAEKVWEKHKDYFNQFDGIITSDTAPLSRIFLQNNFKKPLIIWVCNRFDYYDITSLDCEFPDEEYYQLLRQAGNKKNVYLVPYTSFESVYAADKQVILGNTLIKPSGMFIKREQFQSDIPPHITKSETFFIPPYLNDTAMNLAQECTLLSIKTYQSRYNGPQDLQGFKGIIHIPYSWSNVAFFENMQSGLPYFVPSITFMNAMFDTQKIYWPNNQFFSEHYQSSEWYNKDNSSIITYFDSWDDLKKKIETTDFIALQKKIVKYAAIHKKNTLKKWRIIFNEITTMSY